MNTNILIRFEKTSGGRKIIIDEVDNYLGVVGNQEILEIIDYNDIVEESGYTYFWCDKEELKRKLK